MNESKLKNFLWLALAIAALAGGVSAAGYVWHYGQSIEPPGIRNFAVSGEGKRVSVPDIAQFSFSVVTEGGKNLGELQKQNTAKANKAIEYLKSQQVDSKDIRTIGYNIDPRYDYKSCRPVSDSEFGPPQPVSCPPPEVVGYTITQTSEVKIRNLNEVGEILSGVTAKGANRISGLSFTIDDKSKLEQEARLEAMSKAQEKARAIARAGGFELGKLMSVDEGFSQPVPYYTDTGFGGSEKGGGGFSAPQVEPGSQEIVVTVNLRYEIK